MTQTWQKLHKIKHDRATFTYHCPSYTHHLTVVYRPPDTSVVHENESYTINFNDILNIFDLTNKVQFSTNKQHNTIDFIIAPNKSNYIQNVKQGELFSDHYMILFDIMEPTNIQKFNTVAYHKTKAIKKEECSKDLAKRIEFAGSQHALTKE